MKSRSSSFNIVMIVLWAIILLLVLIGGGGQSPALEQRQALRGETVVNGEVRCDENPQTPAPWCYFIPYDPFNIDAVLP
jgi:hypothetical protein